MIAEEEAEEEGEGRDYAKLAICSHIKHILLPSLKHPDSVSTLSPKVLKKCTFTALSKRGSGAGFFFLFYLTTRNHRWINMLKSAN